MTENIPNSHRLDQKTTETGDHCHYDIKGLTDREAKNFFKQYWKKFEEFTVCNNGNNKSLTREYV